MRRHDGVEDFMTNDDDIIQIVHVLVACCARQNTTVIGVMTVIDQDVTFHVILVVCDKTACGACETPKVCIYFAVTHNCPR
jgi:hypothetical protein